MQVFEGLSGSEQLGLMSALGSYHVWSTLARPDGLHFRLDLTQAEQRDVAREVVKVPYIPILLGMLCVDHVAYGAAFKTYHMVANMPTASPAFS